MEPSLIPAYGGRSVFYFGGSDPAKVNPRSSQSSRSSSSEMPSSETKTMPRMDRPVKSISRAWGRASASG